MANRPNYIDLRSHSSMSTNSRPLRSPRLHVPGEAPPELSPLDAFALQSRLLARQLEETTHKDGRRVSRLPPLTSESPLVVQSRSDYFRSFNDSSSDHEETDTHGAGLGLKMEADSFEERHMSVHPRMSCIREGDNEGPPPTRPSQELFRRRLEQVAEEGNYFGVGNRTGSPEPMENEPLTTTRSHQDSVTSHPSPSARSPFIGSPGKLSTQGSFDASLAPPRPLFPPRSGSPMSQPYATMTDEPMSQSFHSLPPRKMSSGSSAFGGQSPAVAHSQRSPSISSDMSVPLPRPSFNFSRPLSRSGTPGLETPSRQASSDSAPSFVFVDETAHTPVSMNSESFPDSTSESHGAATSYIYSKFILPRGKTLQRTSGLFPDTQQFASSLLESSLPPPSRTPMANSGQPPPSPPTRPCSSHGAGYFEGANFSRPSFDRIPLSHGTLPQASTDLSRASTDNTRMSEETPRGRTPHSNRHQDYYRTRTPLSTTTNETASTLRPPPSKYSLASASELTAEEHLEMGIELHQKGSLNESTYHLRHAARGNNPTGMLLYALACRHGWGMRPNEREGVEWLRRAADGASHEIADEEGQIKAGKKVNTQETKKRKAQFALSIYELGMSHMNGWGIEQDKSLALRCFEIAGSWGDVDALMEAGFCYAEGLGCKKDLKKSAKFYRQAEAKGASMVGNSWIHKSKYNEDTSAKKRARSKSRTRALFSKKG
ncbi:hypothetical protein MKZ38_002253 [Zalerion maritima]|uniref:Uncharacterized protein n=1 Tax=Zalerion maritima TaxID=339359 RepID=A0AAD5WSK0_9PEZI|nr:hypothetical protein MKZ38_002253 [Zalerion maritima]